jgi:tripartite ATP-independent transporter DctP family solute receptor
MIAYSNVQAAEKFPTPKNPLVMKFGHCFPGGKFLGHVAAENLNAYIQKKTNGAIKIQIYPMSQLGGERTMLEQIVGGTLDMGPISINIDATVVPELYAFSLPFAFPNKDVFWDVANNKEFRKKVSQLFWDKARVKLMSFYMASFRGLQNTKKAIRSPKDLKGIKMRVMEGEIFTDIFNALGAATSTLPMPEVYMALQQGLVDGEDCSLFFANMMKLTEVEKFSTEYNGIISFNPLIMAGSTWEKLSPEQQKYFLDYSSEMEAFTRKKWDESSEMGRKVFVEKMSGKLVKNSELTAKEKAAFKAAAQPVWDKYKEVIGEDFYKYFTDVTRKAAKAKGF